MKVKLISSNCLPRNPKALITNNLAISEKLHNKSENLSVQYLPKGEF